MYKIITDPYIFYLHLALEINFYWKLLKNILKGLSKSEKKPALR